jgi:ankyrin repeat protein
MAEKPTAQTEAGVMPAKAPKVTPLLQAVARGEVQRVHELLEAGAAPDDPAALRSPLVQAIVNFQADGSKQLYCNSAMVRDLLDHGADPNRPDPDLHTLPMLATFDVGDMECAHMIRDAGGRIDVADADGNTLLESAVATSARLNDLSILDSALHMGVAPNSRKPTGETALHKTVFINSVPLVKALLERGVDPCIRDDIGQTPLEMAEGFGRSSDMLNLLRSAAQCKEAARGK